MEGSQLQGGAQALLPPDTLSKALLVPNWDTELPQACLGAMRGCWCCFSWGWWGTAAKPGLLWDLLSMAKSCTLGNVSGLAWTSPDFKQQSTP